MLNDVEIDVIKKMAEHDLNVSRVAEVIGYSRRQTYRYVESIEKKTGLNPRKFYDMMKLINIAKEKK